MMMLSKVLHDNLIYDRRMKALSETVIRLLPHSRDGSNPIRILDVGCGDGKIAFLIMQKYDNAHIEGIDVLVRDRTYINVTEYDGYKIPFADDSFDIAMTIDVLHHVDSPKMLISEMKRVAKTIIIKDHNKNGILANTTLRIMDYMGNAHY